MIPSDFVVFLNTKDFSKLSFDDHLELVKSGIDIRNSGNWFDPEEGFAKVVRREDLEGLINANRSD